MSDVCSICGRLEREHHQFVAPKARTDSSEVVGSGAVTSEPETAPVPGPFRYIADWHGIACVFGRLEGRFIRTATQYDLLNLPRK